jgi:CRP-like cAMP-binding protein
MDAVAPELRSSWIWGHRRELRHVPDPAPRFEPLRLLEVDPDLSAGVPDADRRLADRYLTVPSMRVATGEWSPEQDLQSGLGLLVVSGIITCRCPTFGVADVRLFGPGDVFDAPLLCDASSTWQVLLPAHVAVFDARVLLAARRWPQLIVGLTRRLFDGQHEHHRLATIRRLPRVEQRLLALLSHLAYRWGHVTSDGLTVDMPATHQLLGELVGARRPTVSLALGFLKDHALLVRLDDGRWLLPPEAGEWPANGVPNLDRLAAA